MRLNTSQKLVWDCDSITPILQYRRGHAHSSEPPHAVHLRLMIYTQKEHKLENVQKKDSPIGEWVLSAF